MSGAKECNTREERVVLWGKAKRVLWTRRWAFCRGFEDFKYTYVCVWFQMGGRRRMVWNK